ncbi:MAG: F0F1 ATP synthase subunit epsilon [Syntrophomonadaceae bacterium]|nr:F0F1 ATP synthase subunit epsilon [Syntrophomonadaceae bacterium]
MAGTFMLEIVSPEDRIFKDEVQFMVVPEVTGELGVLKNHAPMIAALKIGVMRYTDPDGAIKKMAVSGGFMEVMGNEARVLAETAEPGAQIDVLRAKAAKERAEQRIAAKAEDTNMVRAQMALQRAIARLKAAEPNI